MQEIPRENPGSPTRTDASSQHLILFLEPIECVQFDGILIFVYFFKQGIDHRDIAEHLVFLVYRAWAGMRCLRLVSLALGQIGIAMYFGRSIGRRSKSALRRSVLFVILFHITRTYAGILIPQLDNENLEMLLAYPMKSVNEIMGAD